MKDKVQSMESLESWINSKPYWERLMWKLNSEKELLSEQDIDCIYKSLLNQYGLIDEYIEEETIIFQNEITISHDTSIPGKIMIKEIRDFFHVNALFNGCSIPFNSHLTLIYGANGSGKTGVSRLLSNACFYRGHREILPNVQEPNESNGIVKATFVIDYEDGNPPLEKEYILGSTISDLKRFSVFDSNSILIHLDQSNKVNFRPSQFKIFDKVSNTIVKLENKLESEKKFFRKLNPFLNLFNESDTSSTANFCKNINGKTTVLEFLKHANFDSIINESEITNLKNQIDEKKKLDIPKRKLQLDSDIQNLMAFKSRLENVIDHFTEDKKNEINELTNDILDKKNIVEEISIKNFDDSMFKTIGSSAWKTLITAGKEMYDAEKALDKNREIENCMLCHQKLNTEGIQLFEKYWKFLESKAETELNVLNLKKQSLIKNLQDLKILFPQFLPTDAGVKIVNETDTIYLALLENQFKSLSVILDEWIVNIENNNDVERNNYPDIDLLKIDNIITSKNQEKNNLIDPTDDISVLNSELNSLKHRKVVTGVKDQGIEYIQYLNWLAKIESINLAGIKMTTTKKRTELFQISESANYKGIFNEELAKLNCDFNLVMKTSGEYGNTLKEYRLAFAQNYNPSQILSEGEQNACSIADFLTEIQIDKNNCGIIFDDPVSSLDHDRKELMAKRLVEESKNRQVVIFTHDIGFMSKLVYYANEYSVNKSIHWMHKVNGVPGYVEYNSSPRLLTLSSLKEDSEKAIKNYSCMGQKEREHALGVALDYLRSASEALIEEVLFANTVKRNEDQIRISNLEEVVFDKELALRITELHRKISAIILAHNQSELYREKLITIEDYENIKKEFDELENDLKKALKQARRDRENRKKTNKSNTLGW